MEGGIGGGGRFSIGGLVWNVGYDYSRVGVRGGGGISDIRGGGGNYYRSDWSF